MTILDVRRTFTVTVKFAVPVASVAEMDTTELPDADGTPLIAMVPEPLCVAVNPAGRPLTDKSSGSRAASMMLPEYALPAMGSVIVGVTSAGNAHAEALSAIVYVAAPCASALRNFPMSAISMCTIVTDT